MRYKLYYIIKSGASRGKQIIPYGVFYKDHTNFVSMEDPNIILYDLTELKDGVYMSLIPSHHTYAFPEFHLFFNIDIIITAFEVTGIIRKLSVLKQATQFYNLINKYLKTLNTEYLKN